jgi:hypothetical protein
MTIDAVVGPTEEKMIRLLKFLSDTIIITPDMMERVKIFTNIQKSTSLYV